MRDSVGARRHWVRVTTACNNHCVFCLDANTPRHITLPKEVVKAEIAQGRRDGAQHLVLSGGEPTLHPAFVELVCHGREVGYDRIQVVTNGHMLADRSFFARCVAAGIGEITFSLHGHNAELHDRLTGHPGSFRRLMTGLLRATRHGRLIVNVDIVINRQNVDHLLAIIEHCLACGVREFDLLQIIPQGAAFEHWGELVYDVGKHMPTFRKVFRLAAHPTLSIWTNRFPVEHLEGYEHLIQDPQKLLDEIHGRRFQLRRYVDLGVPLDCRHPERCPHCYIEPFCTTVDRLLARLRRRRWQVWSWPEPVSWTDPLPFGCSLLDVGSPPQRALRSLALPTGAGAYACPSSPEPLGAGPPRRPLVLRAEHPEQLEAWIPLPPGVELDIWLNHQTARWLLAHRERLAAVMRQVCLVQPSYERLHVARAADLIDPRSFFTELGLPVAVAGLPLCLAPGTRAAAPRAILPGDLFCPDTGRPNILPLAHWHLREHFRVKSSRCQACRLSERCEGAHINWVRHRGLAALQPLVAGAWAEEADAQLRRIVPIVPATLRWGRPPEPVAPGLPGFAPPRSVPPDPLAVVAAEQRENEPWPT